MLWITTHQTTTLRLKYSIIKFWSDVKLAKNAEYPHRRSIRLEGYDYSQPGAYFITIVTFHRSCLFGAISDDKVVLNPIGRLVEFE
jgi:hypothetical protein